MVPASQASVYDATKDDVPRSSQITPHRMTPTTARVGSAVIYQRASLVKRQLATVVLPKGQLGIE